MRCGSPSRDNHLFALLVGRLVSPFKTLSVNIKPVFMAFSCRTPIRSESVAPGPQFTPDGGRRDHVSAPIQQD
jgi:hypothetical protein